LLHHQRRQRLALRQLQHQLRRDQAARSDAEQRLAQARAELAQQPARVEGAREAERRRIARDLHDDLGQHLLALACDIAALGAGSPALREHTGHIEAHLRLTMRSLRAVLQDLLPEALESGLLPAVEQQLAQFTRLSGIPCKLQAGPELRTQQRGRPIDATLYRVLQESLSNIVRHARASEVRVALSARAGTLDMTVRDNGVGLPPAPARQGCGLRGIAQRVSEAGGRLHIASSPGQGTALSMSFPLETAQ
jgi:signal transduction histidine kinase